MNFSKVRRHSDRSMQSLKAGYSLVKLNTASSYTCAAAGSLLERHPEVSNAGDSDTVMPT